MVLDRSRHSPSPPRKDDNEGLHKRASAKKTVAATSVGSDESFTERLSEAFEDAPIDFYVRMNRDLNYIDSRLHRRVLYFVVVSTLGFFIFDPWEIPYLKLMIVLHIIGLGMRYSCGEFKDGELKQAGNIQMLLSWMLDIIGLLQVTPLSFASLACLGWRGQTFGMYTYGLQVVQDLPCKDGKLKVSKEPQWLSGPWGFIRLVVRITLNLSLFLLSPITLLIKGKSIGGLVTGTIVVCRPIPTDVEQHFVSGMGMGRTLERVLSHLLPVATGGAIFLLFSMVLTAQGLNGMVLMSKAWFWVTASEGAGQWNLTPYPEPHQNLPQYLDKEGGAMWFSMAPHQLANMDLVKYTRFLQHRFSLVNVMAAMDVVPLNTLADYATIIPEMPEISAFDADSLGFTKYLNVVHMFNGLSAWNSMTKWERPEEVPYIQGIERPSLTQSWQEDAEFARQQISGANPMSIVWAKDGKLPSAFNTTKSAVKLLDAATKAKACGADFGAAKAAKKLFYSDYEMMGRVTVRANRTLYPAIVVMCADKAGELQPIGIQLTRQGEDRMYTPLEANPKAWLFAKMHAMSTDGLYHQMAVHLMQCHLSMEPIIVSINANLEPSKGESPNGHPIADLLAPHFHRTIGINSFGRYTMLGGSDDPENPPIFDVITSIGVVGTLDLMQHAYVEQWHIIDSAFPNHLQGRGFTREEPSFLKGYTFKEDGYLVWDAIEEYVQGALDSAYPTDSAVKDDQALQKWFQQMRTPKGKEGGAEVRGTPAKMEDKASLRLILAGIIFQATALHSAVNFGQWEYYAMVPNRPLALTRPMPADTAEVTEDYIVSALPKRREVDDMLNTARALTLPSAFPLLSRAGKKWQEGESPFQHERFMYLMRFPEAFRKFEARLQEVEDTVNQRNSKRKWPYKYLAPSFIPSSIAI